MKPHKTLPELAIGIYDPISALLAARAGAKKLWLSSYCYSLCQGYPDFGLLPFTAELSTLSRIRRLTKAPLIVDADNAFSSPAHAAQLAKTLELMSVWGICIEDKNGPKSSSLYQATRTQLLSVRDYEELLISVRKAAPKIRVIARLEGLNYGSELDEINKKIQRVWPHSESIVLHFTEERYPVGILELLKSHQDKKFTLIPTTYLEHLEELLSPNVHLIILANHALRAAAQSIESTITKLLGYDWSAVPDLSVLKELDPLVLGSHVNT